MFQCCQLLLHANSFTKSVLIFSMNGMIYASVLLAFVAAFTEATWVWGTTTAATATTVSTASATSLALLGGVVLLKGLILGAALLSSRGRGRGKRSAEDDTFAAFAILADTEPAQCYKRLICDFAAGAIADDDHILSLFNNEVDIQSPKFEFATAAKVGKATKSSQYCELRYHCPLNTVQIQSLFN